MVAIALCDHAECVGVDLDALATFMHVAEAKLAAVASEQPPT